GFVLRRAPDLEDDGRAEGAHVERERVEPAADGEERRDGAPCRAGFQVTQCYEVGGAGEAAIAPRVPASQPLRNTVLLAGVGARAPARLLGWPRRRHS